MQHKAFEVTNFDKESRKISGYAAVFNNIDKAKDKLIKGCFAKSIEERGPASKANDKIIFLWQHDQREPIGRITELREDETGLYFEAVLDEIELGDRTLKQLESGTLNQFSIGFTYVHDHCEWNSEEKCLIVKEVKLYEISVVSIGCNGQTKYLGLKSVEDYESAFEELTQEIADATKHMSVKKQAWIQHIISKAMSLACVEPEVLKNAPLDEKKADSDEVKSLFNFQIIKRV